MNEQEEQQVLQCLLDSADEEMSLADLKPETSLREDLGLDSLAAVALAVQLEEALATTITIEEMTALETIRDVFELITTKMRNSAV